MLRPSSFIAAFVVSWAAGVESADSAQRRGNMEKEILIGDNPIAWGNAVTMVRNDVAAARREGATKESFDKVALGVEVLAAVVEKLMTRLVVKKSLS